MALKPRKAAPTMSAAEKSFVKRQALGAFTTGRPPGRPQRPRTSPRPLVAALNRANGVQTGKREA